MVEVKKSSMEESSRLRDILLSLACIILGCQAIVWITGVPSFILPSPLKVALAFINNLELLGEHTWVTALEVIAGLILGTFLGAMTALYLMWSDAARRLAMPVLVLSQTIPVFALAPILTLWLGYGIGSKIAMTILIIYFPVASTFLDGLRQTPKGYLDLAQSMRATRAATLFNIRYPSPWEAPTHSPITAPIGA